MGDGKGVGRGWKGSNRWKGMVGNKTVVRVIQKKCLMPPGANHEASVRRNSVKDLWSTQHLSLSLTPNTNRAKYVDHTVGVPKETSAVSQEMFLLNDEISKFGLDPNPITKTN